MSSTIESTRVAHPQSQPAIALVPLGLSLSTFLAITFLLCVIGDYIPLLSQLHFLSALYPDVDWRRPEMIGLGVVWAFGSGWYVALAFGSLYNFFARKRP